MLQELGTYLRLLLSKWGAGAFLILDAVAFFAGALFPQLVLPTWVYWTVAGLVFLGANFAVYLDLNKELATYKTPVDAKVEPKLSIELVAGRAYTFSLEVTEYYDFWLNVMEKAEAELQRAKQEEDQEEIKEQRRIITEARLHLEKLEPSEIAPDGLISLHMRVMNVGGIGVDIVHIGVRYKESDSDTWDFLNAKLLKTDGTPLAFPTPLPPQSHLLIDAVTTIHVERLGPARLAAALGTQSSHSPQRVNVFITVYGVSERGEQVQFRQQVSVDTRDLKELYISRWREKGRIDLLKLAQVKDY